MLLHGMSQHRPGCSLARELCWPWCPPRATRGRPPVRRGEPRAPPRSAGRGRPPLSPPPPRNTKNHSSRPLRILREILRPRCVPQRGASSVLHPATRPPGTPQRMGRGRRSPPGCFGWCRLLLLCCSPPTRGARVGDVCGVIYPLGIQTTKRAWWLCVCCRASPRGTLLVCRGTYHRELLEPTWKAPGLPSTGSVRCVARREGEQQRGGTTKGGGSVPRRLSLPSLPGVCPVGAGCHGANSPAAPRPLSNNLQQKRPSPPSEPRGPAPGHVAHPKECWVAPSNGRLPP